VTENHTSFTLCSAEIHFLVVTIIMSHLSAEESVEMQYDDVTNSNLPPDNDEEIVCV
jgi:hypothetical protein